MRLVMGLAPRWTGCCRDAEPLLRQPPTALQPPGNGPCCCLCFLPIRWTAALADTCKRASVKVNRALLWP